MSIFAGPPGPDTDTDYLIRRESQERQAAEQASDPAVRRIHAALADGYAARRAKPARAL